MRTWNNCSTEKELQVYSKGYDTLAPECYDMVSPHACVCTSWKSSLEADIREENRLVYPRAT